MTRSATGDQLGRAFGAQLFGRRQPVILTAGILTVLGLMPGMPLLPCLLLAGGLLFAARKIGAKPVVTAAAPAPSAAQDPKRSAAEVDAALALDLLSLEVGYELVGLVDASRGGTLLDRVALAAPAARARTSASSCRRCMSATTFSFRRADTASSCPATRSERAPCKAGRLLAIDPTGTAPAIEGERTVEPTFGMPARWIALRDKEMAEALGYTVVDHATVVATHLGELLRTNAHRLLGRQEVQHLLEVVARTTPKVVDDVVPNLLSLGDVVRVLRNLVREGISIRDMRTILESLAELSAQTKDVEQLTESVRERLSPHITSRVKGPDGNIAALTLDGRLEEVLRRSLREIASGTGGAIDPEMLRNVTASAERVPQEVQRHFGDAAGRDVSRSAPLRARDPRAKDSAAVGRLLSRNRPQRLDPGARPTRARTADPSVRST